MKTKQFIICNSKTSTAFFGETEALLIDLIKKEVTNKVYRNGGITWIQNGKQFHSEDIAQWGEEQMKQISIFGNIYKGSKKPANGWKREVSVTVL